VVGAEVTLGRKCAVGQLQLRSRSCREDGERSSDSLMDRSILTAPPRRVKDCRQVFHVERSLSPTSPPQPRLPGPDDRCTEDDALRRPALSEVTDRDGDASRSTHRRIPSTPLTIGTRKQSAGHRPRRRRCARCPGWPTHRASSSSSFRAGSAARFPVVRRHRPTPPAAALCTPSPEMVLPASALSGPIVWPTASDHG
jgi:hypothetical protein